MNIEQEIAEKIRAKIHNKFSAFDVQQIMRKISFSRNIN